MLQRIKAFVRDSKAVSALEYAILVGVVAVAAFGILTTFNNEVQTAVDTIGTNVKGKVKNVGK